MKKSKCILSLLLAVLTGISVFRTVSSDSFTAKAMIDYNGQTVYCIEPGVSLNTGNSLSGQAEGFWDNYPPSLNSTNSSAAR